MHTAVVVGELALATVLMVSGALLTRSLFALNRVDPGFEREGLLAVRLAIPMQRYSDDPEGLTAVDSDFQRIVDEIRALPAVREVGVVLFRQRWSSCGFQGVILQLPPTGSSTTSRRNIESSVPALVPEKFGAANTILLWPA